MACFTDKLLFLHVPKCAGRSCRRYLFEHVPGMVGPDPDSKTPTDDSGLPIGHVRLEDIERFTGRKPESFEKVIAVIRNPYEQQLSQWVYWKERFAVGYRRIHDCVAANYPTITDFLMDARCDFHAWYDEHHGYQAGDTRNKQTAMAPASAERPEGENRYEHFGGMFRFWVTVDDEIPGNVQVVRFENLAEEFRAAVQPFTAFSAVADMPSLPWTNRSSHPYKTHRYYTPEAALLVEQKAKWAFDNYYEKWLWSSFAT